MNGNFESNRKYEVEIYGKKTGKFFWGIEFNLYMRGIRSLLTI